LARSESGRSFPSGEALGEEPNMQHFLIELLRAAQGIAFARYLLSGATVACVLGLVVWFVWLRPLEDEAKTNWWALLTTASMLALAAAWLFAYRNELRLG
jgi:hypothetical protein